MRRTWLTVRRDVREGRACRVHTVVDDEGAPRYTAVAFPWRRAIEITDGTGAVAFRIVRRRTFPLTGAFDVSLPDGEWLGTLNRNGKVRDASGAVLGRLRDERSMKARVGQSAAEGLMNLLAGLDDSSVSAGPSGYIWMVEGLVAGALKRSKWPFATSVPGAGDQVEPAGRSRWRRRLSALIGRAEDPTWCFTLAVEWRADARLEMAAAICGVELTYW